MGKFLAILHGTTDDESKNELSAEQQSDLMRAWGAWAKANQDALVDPGAPLYVKKMVSSQGIEDFTDTKVAYVIVKADSHDDAVRIFSEHPHLGLMGDNSIEVLECPPPRG